MKRVYLAGPMSGLPELNFPVVRCAMCSRPLKRATVTLQQMSLGPKCAERAGFIARRSPGAKLFSPLVVVRDKRTADMFEGVA